MSPHHYHKPAAAAAAAGRSKLCVRVCSSQICVYARTHTPIPSVVSCDNHQSFSVGAFKTHPKIYLDYLSLCVTVFILPQRLFELWFEVFFVFTCKNTLCNAFICFLCFSFLCNCLVCWASYCSSVLFSTYSSHTCFHASVCLHYVCLSKALCCSTCLLMKRYMNEIRMKPHATHPRFGAKVTIQRS